MKNFIRFLLLSFLFIGTTPIAELNAFELGVHGGTTGPGIEAFYRDQGMAFRIGGRYFSRALSQGISLGTVNADVAIKSIKAGVDFYAEDDFLVFNSEWYVSLGVINRGHQISGDLIPEDTSVGSLQWQLKTGNPLCPYVGMGWRSKPLLFGIGIHSEVSFIYQGEPSLEITGTGLLRHSEIIEQEINQNINEAVIYPNIDIGFFYQF